MAEQDRGAGIVLADTEGRIRHWDAGAEALFGFTAAEATGRSLDLIVPAEHRERHWAGFRRAMETSTCSIDRAAMNLPVLCSDGTRARSRVGESLG